MPDYSFKVDEKKKVAVMDFRSFNNPQRMKMFADSMFVTLREKGIKNLIIDLRNNGGGNSMVGDVLFRYISPKPFKQMGKALVRVTPTTIRLTGRTQMVPGWSFIMMNQKEILFLRSPKKKVITKAVYIC